MCPSTHEYLPAAIVPGLMTVRHPGKTLNCAEENLGGQRATWEAWEQVRVEFKRALALPSAGLATPPGIRGWASVTRSSMGASAPGAAPTGPSPGAPLLPLP